MPLLAIQSSLPESNAIQPSNNLTVTSRLLTPIDPIKVDRLVPTPALSFLSLSDQSCWKFPEHPTGCVPEKLVGVYEQDLQLSIDSPGGRPLGSYALTPLLTSHPPSTKIVWPVI